jgi:hypothetical protein
MEEGVADIDIQVCAFGFGLQQLVVGSLGNIEIAIDLAGAEFDFQQSLAWGVRDPGQCRGYKGHAMHGFAAGSIFGLSGFNKKHLIVKLF